jgi:hypothetical protein
MNIPEMLKIAFDRKDWNLISDVYNSLTGQKLESFQTTIKKAEARQEPPRQQSVDIPVTGKKTKPCRAEPINVGEKKFNLFRDDGSIKEEPTRTQAGQKGIRRSDLVKASCADCGVVHEVNAIFNASTTGYVCNKCLERKGG